MNLEQVQLPKGQKLSLRNDGNLELFFIGVGSAFAKRNRQTNFLIIKGDAHVMVDFGMTGPTALHETAGLDVTDLQTFLPTHSHADHVGGLEAAALMNRYVGMKFMKKPKLEMIINETYQEILWDRTLRGGMEWNEEETDTHKKLTFSDFFNVVRPSWVTRQPREIWHVDYKGISLTMFRTKHIPDSAQDWQASFISFGLVIDDQVFVSCDSRFDPDLFEMFSHCPYVFHDVQFFPGAVHAPLNDLRTMTHVVPKMRLMHYGDNWDQQDISGFAGWTLPGVRYIFKK